MPETIDKMIVHHPHGLHEGVASAASATCKYSTFSAQAENQELVKYSRLPASALIEDGSDHRLADPGGWRRCWGRA
jgi:hypothetical protein